MEQSRDLLLTPLQPDPLEQFYGTRRQRRLSPGEDRGRDAQPLDEYVELGGEEREEGVEGRTVRHSERGPMYPLLFCLATSGVNGARAEGLWLIFQQGPPAMV